ncbi:PilX N-terminal domain-containing pilus assembly protein [Herbaspirillum rhizosphaerae]|uniref:PilX N-terminal domain-containing pilus assembly protein n=1 Tax=Herbaspirillum rhizosphaerae TaxID=346179 RepID=A0ABW8ZHB9_9BURK
MMRRHRQSGASLLIALIMLIVVMLLGVTAARMSLMNEKSSRSDRDRQIAFEAAEAALRDAELDLSAGSAHSANVRGQMDAFPALPGRCHESGPFAGLCRAGNTPLWASFNMLAPTPWIDYGRYSAQHFPYGAASLAARPPRYLIELITVGKSAASASAVQRLRVTAVGFGSRESTQVVLQSIYTIHAAPDSPYKPPVRISWREIGNWQEI